MIVESATNVYPGMIVGINSRKNDLVVNPCKNKNLTNVRSSGSDDAIKLLAPLTFTLEEALEFIESDELVEITPDVIRLRKKVLDENARKRYNKEKDDVRLLKNTSKSKIKKRDLSKYLNQLHNW